MPQNISIRFKKTVSENGEVTRFYTFVLKEPKDKTLPINCEMLIKDGKIEDIDLDIINIGEIEMNPTTMKLFAALNQPD